MWRGAHLRLRTGQDGQVSAWHARASSVVLHAERMRSVCIFAGEQRRDRGGVRVMAQELVLQLKAEVKCGQARAHDQDRLQGAHQHTQADGADLVCTVDNCMPYHVVDLIPLFSVS